MESWIGFFESTKKKKKVIKVDTIHNVFAQTTYSGGLFYSSVFSLGSFLANTWNKSNSARLSRLTNDYTPRVRENGVDMLTEPAGITL